MLSLTDYLKLNEEKNWSKSENNRNKRKLIKGFKEFLDDNETVSKVVIYGVIKQK